MAETTNAAIYVKPFYTPEELADLLNIGRNTAYSQISAGRYGDPATLHHGRNIRIPASAIFPGLTFAVSTAPEA